MKKITMFLVCVTVFIATKFNAQNEPNPIAGNWGGPWSAGQNFGWCEAQFESAGRVSLFAVSNPFLESYQIKGSMDRDGRFQGTLILNGMPGADPIIGLFFLNEDGSLRGELTVTSGTDETPLTLQMKRVELLQQ
jgi:hypothetical protein